jgi:hypothetical protein
MASATGLLDICRRRWHPEALAAVGIRPARSRTSWGMVTRPLAVILMGDLVLTMDGKNRQSRLRIQHHSTLTRRSWPAPSFRSVRTFFSGEKCKCLGNSRSPGDRLIIFP